MEVGTQVLDLNQPGMRVVDFENLNKGVDEEGPVDRWMDAACDLNLPYRRRLLELLALRKSIARRKLQASSLPEESIVQRHVDSITTEIGKIHRRLRGTELALHPEFLRREVYV